MQIYIDIETIPGEHRPCVDEVQAPANYKDPEKIRAYQLANVDEAYRKQALDSMAGRIWCIGVAIDDGPVTVSVSDNENDLVGGLHNMLNKETHGVVCQSDMVFIGHNAFAFDMKWIWRRAVKIGCKSLAQRINFDRYRGNIRDTMTMWGCGDNRDYVSLDKLAEFLGVGRKAPGMDGSKVFDLWQAGDTAAVIEYCKQDVELTREVYKRLAF